MYRWCSWASYEATWWARGVVLPGVVWLVGPQKRNHNSGVHSGVEDKGVWLRTPSRHTSLSLPRKALYNVTIWLRGARPGVKYYGRTYGERSPPPFLLR